MTALVRYDQARAALEAARHVDEVKDIRDKAQAMAAYARQAKDTELVAWATEIKVRAERRCGEMLKESAQHGKRAKPGRPEKMSHDTTFLPDLNISRDQSSRWQRLATMPAAAFEAAVTTAKTVAGEITTAFLLRQADTAAFTTHRTAYSGAYEWYTPAQCIAKAREVMETIDLDPASSALAQETVQATRYFSLDDDALVQDWRGNVWLNPPYSQPDIAHFVDKLLAEWTAGHMAQAILLTNNSTDTAWFHNAMEHASALCFTRGRLQFVSAWRESRTPPQGQTFFYFGPAVARFATVFAAVGRVLVDYARIACCQAGEASWM